MSSPQDTIYGALDDSTCDIEKGAQSEIPVASQVTSTRDNISKHALFNHTSHFWATEAEYYDGSHSRSLRMQFISKVYSILTFQLLLTVIVGSVFIEVSPVRELVVANASTFVLVTIIPTFLTILALTFYKDEYPTNYILLVTFTLLEALSIGTVCAVYQQSGAGALVLQAAFITLCVFLCLTVFSFQTRIDFTPYTGLLLMMLVALLVTGLIASLFGFQIHTLYATLGAVIFCAFIVVDTQMIMNRLGYGDYIIASIELYLDILNLFLFVLQLLTNNSRADRGG